MPKTGTWWPNAIFTFPSPQSWTWNHTAFSTTKGCDQGPFNQPESYLPFSFHSCYSLKIINERKGIRFHIAYPAILCSHGGNWENLGFMKLEILTVSILNLELPTLCYLSKQNTTCNCLHPRAFFSNRYNKMTRALGGNSQYIRWYPHTISHLLVSLSCTCQNFHFKNEIYTSQRLTFISTYVSNVGMLLLQQHFIWASNGYRHKPTLRRQFLNRSMPCTFYLHPHIKRDLTIYNDYRVRNKPSLAIRAWTARQQKSTNVKHVYTQQKSHF